MAVLKGAFLFCFPPKHFIVSVRVKRWVYVNQIDAGVGERLEFVETVATVDDAGVNQGGAASAQDSFAF
jgi:hypothetical protein